MIQELQSNFIDNCFQCLADIQLDILPGFTPDIGRFPTGCYEIYKLIVLDIGQEQVKTAGAEWWEVDGLAFDKNASEIKMNDIQEG